MKLYKSRGINSWSGRESIDNMTIRGYATLTPSGQYEVLYDIDNGYGHGLKGTFVCAKLKDAEAKLTSKLANNINVIHYDTMPLKDDVDCCYDRDGDIFCPNCLEYCLTSADNGLKECTYCGCCFDPS